MKIAEVSEQFGLSIDTLRYYERVGLIPPVNRNESGIRDYNELDLRRVDFIKCMRSAGLPVEVLIEYVGLVQKGDKPRQGDEQSGGNAGRFRIVVTRLSRARRGLGTSRRDGGRGHLRRYSADSSP